MIKDKMNTVEEQALGEKWDELQEKDAKNTHKEIKLLKKKIKYLRERVSRYETEIAAVDSKDDEDLMRKKMIYLKEKISIYETELATLEGSYKVKNRHQMEDDGLNRLAEMKRTIGEDLTRRF